MTWPKSCAILLLQTLSNLCWCSESATPRYRSFNLCVKNMSTLWWSSELFSNLSNHFWENLSCYKKILLLLLFLISVIRYGYTTQKWGKLPGCERDFFRLIGNTSFSKMFFKVVRRYYLLPSLVYIFISILPELKGL